MLRLARGRTQITADADHGRGGARPLPVSTGQVPAAAHPAPLRRDLFPMVHSRLLAAPLLAALLAIAPALGAQRLTAGALAGVARDARGSPVPGALVTVTDLAGGPARVATTSPGGGF